MTQVLHRVRLEHRTDRQGKHSTVSAETGLARDTPCLKHKGLGTGSF